MIERETEGRKGCMCLPIISQGLQQTLLTTDTKFLPLDVESLLCLQELGSTIGGLHQPKGLKGKMNHVWV